MISHRKIKNTLVSSTKRSLAVVVDSLGGNKGLISLSNCLKLCKIFELESMFSLYTLVEKAESRINEARSLSAQPCLREEIEDTNRHEGMFMEFSQSMRILCS